MEGSKGLEGVISTARLALVPMTPAFLRATLEGEQAAAEAAIGAAVPAEWLDEGVIARIFLDKHAAFRGDDAWLARAVVLRETGAMIGHCGFHGPPGMAHLEPYLPGGVELGYTVYPALRGRGYATEAVRGLMAWAAAQGVPGFVLSIASDNAPSLAIARRLGFARVGSHVDDEDGPEEIFALHTR